MDYNYLKQIINKKPINPTIINTKSNFVVSTYWWGRGNFNQNTARPCILFYEKIFSLIQNLCVEYLTDIKESTFDKASTNLETFIESVDEFNKIIENRANAYNGMIFEDLGIEHKDEERYKKAKIILEKKTNNKSPEDFKYKNKEEVITFLKVLIKEFISSSKSNIINLAKLYRHLNMLKDAYLKNTYNDSITLKKEINKINMSLKKESEVIKANLKLKKNYDTPQLEKYRELSLYDIMHKELRYLSPIKYDDMITLWENACKKTKCNYMAIEYPEFAKPGGYQLAINAKPLFIQKALDSVGKSRSVLYIDGDMFIRKYPKIFDFADIDFMGRGWNMDPRASSMMNESITYDPYTFETSGGTMWFSQTNEAKNLINYWVNISSDPAQAGKADDRLLSLIFNTSQLLCGMKIIQLPIEYLWLTLDYNEVMLETLYDYDKPLMEKTIFIEHSECLTSEDTAESGGASSDRTPDNYKILELNIDPVSEQFHEYMMFPSSEMVKTLRPYLDYMNSAQYFNDGNPILVKKGFVNPLKPEDNEQPLYITPYKAKYGNTKYFMDDSLTWNDVAKITDNKANSINTNELNLGYNKKNNMVEINDLSMFIKDDKTKTLDKTKIISLIIKLLKDNKNVVYNPKGLPGYKKEQYGLLHKLLKKSNNSLEFIFTPHFDYDYESSNFFYKPKFLLNQPIFFKPCDILIKFLSMFISLDDFSSYLNYGSYEFISRVRVGYNIDTNDNTSSNMKGGESKHISNYEYGLNLLYKHDYPDKPTNRSKKVLRHHKKKTRRITKY